MSSPTPTPQPALATTKRKFHRLIDNLTASTSTTSLASSLHSLHESNASSASLPETSSTPADAPPTKRSRLSDASMEKPRAVSGTEGRIRALQEKLFTPRGKSHSAATGERNPKAGLRAVNGGGVADAPAAKLVAPRKEPNFQPYSQEQFLGRLKTFADVKKWTNKPDAVNEVAWAKRGWVCDGWNTVACKGGCEQRVVVKLYPKRKDEQGREIEMSEEMADEGVDEGLVERVRELVVEGHYEDCLWRKRGCQDDIYHIPIPNRAKSSTEMLDRYRSLKAIAADLPALENITYPDPSIQEILQRIPSTFFTAPHSTTPEPVPSTPSEQTAFAFALFGWSGESESKISLATCGHCFQRIGLWLYESSKLQDMSAKLEVPIETLRCNLLEAHRDHCPWKNAASQRNPKDGPIRDMAGWQTLEFLLMGRNNTNNNQSESGRPHTAHGHTRNQSIATVASEMESYRSSFESDRGTMRTEKSSKGKEEENLTEKWRKFKAKLKRTTSRKSLRSVKSTKSGKSVYGDKDKDKEIGMPRE